MNDDPVIIILLLALSGFVIIWRESMHNLRTLKLFKKMKTLESEYHKVLITQISLIEKISKIEEYYKIEKLLK